MALGKFWKVNRVRVLVVLAVVSLIGAGVYGQLSYSTDVEPYLSEAYPEASSFLLLNSAAVDENYLYAALDSNEDTSVYVSASQAQGYGGPITVLVTWTLDGFIQDVYVAAHNDTPSWFDKLGESEFYSQYIGREYSQPLLLNDDIDAVSGATYSSIGVSGAVAMGRLMMAEQLGDPYPVTEVPIKFGINEIVLLAGLGAVVTIRTFPPLRRRPSLRYLTLAVGLLILGVWLSTPLSLINFAIWPVGFAPSWQINIYLYILVFGIVGLSLIFAKNFWCFWMCPFAAIQEGAHFLGGGRVRPITKRQLLLRNTRYVLLWLVLMVVLVSHSPSVSGFEPWHTIFSLKGNPVQWLLVVVTIGIAMFVYDFWCHFLCPVGAMMDIVLKIRRWFVSVGQRVFAR